MGRSLIPILCGELANLEKDAESRKSATKALKSYVRDLDARKIPLFLAQLAERKGPGQTDEYTITLYEILARVHGHNIVPHIDNIMLTIVTTLKSSAGSFPLHQACSKVVPAIAKYGIDPSIPEGEKEEIIRSLCNPLCDILMGPSETVAAGAALCLKALVESDGWQFAPDDVVNDICLRTVGALEEKLMQTNSHMGLAMALAKHNSLTVEAFARSLVLSGLQILTTGNANSQKRLSSIQMINFLIKCVDSRSIFSELVTIIHVMEKCQKDQMPFVRGAAYEALQTARMVAAEKGSKILKDSSPITGSNFSRRDNGRMKNLSSVRVDRSGSGSRSPRSLSPESRTITSFSGFDSFTESPLSTGQASCNYEYGRPANRRLWKNESGGVDVSLKDGLYSEVNSDCNFSKIYFDDIGDSELSDSERGCSEVFTNSVPVSPRCMETQSTNHSPQRHQLQYNIDDIFTTPRKFTHSLQDSDDCDLESLKKENQTMRSPTSSEVGGSPMREINGVDVSRNLSYEVEAKSSMRENEATQKDIVTDDDMGPDVLKFVSSTDDAPPDSTCKVLHEVGQKEKNAIGGVKLKARNIRKASLCLVCGLALVVPAVILLALWLDNEEECFNLVPT
ncbi:hypothetical protein AAC387_Pa01g2838 [Persea americana]